jgi:hypothetical protein
LNCVQKLQINKLALLQLKVVDIEELTEPLLVVSKSPMSELTPEKIKELTALMASAPPATAARLLAMFERMKVKGSQVIPSNDLIIAMREAGMTAAAGQAQSGVRLPSFERLFFEPFEDLFESGPSEDLLPGSIARAGLAEVWQLVARDFAPEAVRLIEPAGREAILAGDMDRARDLATRLRKELLDHLKGTSCVGLERLGSTPEARTALQRLIPLLVAEAIGREIWASTLALRADLSDAGFKKLCGQVSYLESENPDAACELMLLTMCTFRPAEALRILAKVTQGADDKTLDASRFAVVGRRVIAAATRSAHLIEAATGSNAFDGAELAVTVDRYNQNLVSLEREIWLSHNGPWRHAVTAIRNKVGNRLELLCEAATDNLELVLPVDRIQRHTITWTYEPKFDAPIDPAKLAIVTRHLAFVAASRLCAPVAGFGAARDKAIKHANAYIQNVSDALLRVARQPQRPRHFDAWVHATASVIEALEGVSPAHLFERRIAATRAAA